MSIDKTTKFIDSSRKVHGNKYDYSKVIYVTLRKKVIIIYNKKEYLQSPYNHLNGCKPEYKAENVISDTASFILKARQVHGNKYIYDKTEYIHNKKKLTITCPFHGDFKQRALDHTSTKCGCPKCGIRISNIEDKVENFLLKNNINFIKNNRSILSKLELDFYIPKFNLGIECHGNFWHSEAAFYSGLNNKDLTHYRTHSIKKFKLAKEKNIELLIFFADEILFKFEIVKRILKNKLNLYEGYYHARKMNIEVVTSNEANNFYDTYHIQGRCSAKVHLALKNRDKIYSVMSFSNNVSNRGSLSKKGIWELVRFASKNRVNGAASKLFKHFLKNNYVKKIISFSDNRFFNGRIYQFLGFKLKKELKQDYYYVHKKFKYLKRYHKSYMKKSNQKKNFKKFFR